MKSPGKIAKIKNDNLIRVLINDPYYKVHASGLIETKISREGHVKDWRIKPQHHGHDGYKTITYKKVRLFVHRIIYAKWGRSPLRSDMEVNHIDGIGINNHIENLEQISPSKNCLHRYQHLKRPYPGAKITKRHAKIIRRAYEKGEKVGTLAERFELSNKSIYNVIRNRTWTNI